MNVLGDISRLGAKRYSERTALILKDEKLTYRQLNQKVNRLAQGILSQGIRPGDRVALLGMNSIDWVIANLSIAKCGAVVTALNFRYKTGEIVYAINNSGSRLLIFSPEFLPMVEEAKKDFNLPVKLVAMSDDYCRRLDGRTVNK